MIILPDRSISHTKFLLPMKRKDWLPPSVSLPKDTFGKETTTTFRVALKHKKKLVWEGSFRDREDFDEFLFGLASESLQYDRYLWTLPIPELNPDVLKLDDIVFYFATQTIYTGSAFTTTYNKPIDWNDYANKFECLGGGGQGGGCSSTSGNGGAGGGGGSFSRTINSSLLAGQTTFRVSGQVNSGIIEAGSPGSAGRTVSFVSGSTGGTTICLAVGGGGGPVGSGTGGVGANTTSNVYGGTGYYEENPFLSWPGVSYSGGNGGLGSWTTASIKGAGGGGGAAGNQSAGGNEPGNGYGGDAGSAIDYQGNLNIPLSGGAQDSNGQTGNDFGSGFGFGSGCGRKTTGSGNLTSGNYGAGGGGARSTGASLRGGMGANGLALISYVPYTVVPTNIPNMGI